MGDERFAIDTAVPYQGDRLPVVVTGPSPGAPDGHVLADHLVEIQFCLMFEQRDIYQATMELLQHGETLVRRGPGAGSIDHHIGVSASNPEVLNRFGTPREFDYRFDRIGLGQVHRCIGPQLLRHLQASDRSIDRYDPAIDGGPNRLHTAQPDNADPQDDDRFSDGGLRSNGIDVDVAWLGGGYVKATGNSFAAPNITAVVALLLEKHPGLTPFQVKSVLSSLAANSYTGPDPEESI